MVNAVPVGVNMFMQIEGLPGQCELGPLWTAAMVMEWPLARRRAALQEERRFPGRFVEGGVTVRQSAGVAHRSDLMETHGSGCRCGRGTQKLCGVLILRKILSRKEAP